MIQLNSAGKRYGNKLLFEGTDLLITAQDRVGLVGFPPFAPAGGEIMSAHETANSADLRVRADGRAFLIMSVTPHRYWQATIDGRPARLEARYLPYANRAQALCARPARFGRRRRRG